MSVELVPNSVELVPNNVDSQAVEDAGLGRHLGRIVVADVNGVLKGGFFFVSAYLHAGAGMSGDNLSLLGDLGEWLSAAPRPWILGMDANLTPQRLSESGWLQQVRQSYRLTHRHTSRLASASIQHSRLCVQKVGI